MNRFLVLVTLPFLFGCANTQQPESNKAIEPQGEVAIVAFLDETQATQTLLEWRRQKLAFTVLSYDTDIHAGAFKICSARHAYYFLDAELKAKRILMFDLYRKPKVEWRLKNE